MSLYGALDGTNTSTDLDERKLTISVGRVVDTNDPMQMGRVRVFIPGLDRNTSNVGEIPFAIYCSPFAGHQQVQSRGPEDNTYTTGPVAYGMFSIPPVGTDVIVAHLNGDPNYRIWFGALYGILLNGTLPHGRYTFNNPANPGQLDGPLSAAEKPIQPLYDNLTQAYTRDSAVASNDAGSGLPPRQNFEWRVRGADYQAAALGNIQKNLPSQVVSDIADDRNYSFTEEDGKPFKGGDYTQGYSKSRIEPNATYDPGLVDGGENLAPQTYSWTTPGFSSVAMDDRPENARIRLRTGSGHQVILDDTNERIYISTVEGNNWVEMDQSGNVDIYAARRVSIHSAMDVNITTEGTFRVNAKQGIHLDSEQEVRITSKADTHLQSYGATRVKSVDDMNLESGADANIKVTGTTNIQSGSAININSGAGLNVESVSDTNIKSGGVLNLSSTSDTNIKSGAALNLQSSSTANVNSGAGLNLQSSGDTNLKTGGTGNWQAPATINLVAPTAVNLNSGGSAGSAGTATAAGTASPAAVSETHDAYFTNRVPEHEPWGRIMMKQTSTDQDSGNEFVLELSYTDVNVGRVELGETITRNSRWHR